MMMMRVRRIQRNLRRDQRQSKSQTKWLRTGKQPWRRNPRFGSSEKSPKPLRLLWLQPRVKEALSVNTKLLTVQVGCHVWYKLQWIHRRIWKMEIKFYILDFLKCTSPFVLFLSAVFNALVLLCIKEIDVTLQKLLNLKMDKDQKKYKRIMWMLHLFTCTLLICYSVFLFFVRLVLPSSSPRWQKNQIDIKMYLSGVVQVWTFIFKFLLKKLHNI